MNFDFNNIKKAITSILPTYKKTQILDTIEKSLDELQNVTIPSYEAANEIFTGQKFKSSEIKAMQARFDLNRLGSGSANMVTTILAILNNAKGFAITLSKYVGKVISSEEASVSMNLRKATVLRLVIMVEFANRYARRLLNYIYTCELDSETKTTDYALNKANTELITKEFNNFTTALRVLNRKPDLLAKDLEGLSEANVDELSDQTLAATANVKSIDPLLISGFTEYNPFYIFGMVVAQYQANKFNSVEDEKKMLELRYLRLTQARAGDASASTDREMEILQERIDNCTRKWLNLKEEYGV
jgi:hypothetical protein